MKIYEIKNSDYETKRVVAYDMENAIVKYRRYLHDHINTDFSDENVFGSVTSCTYVGEYEDDDMIK